MKKLLIITVMLFIGLHLSANTCPDETDPPRHPPTRVLKIIPKIIYEVTPVRKMLAPTPTDGNGKSYC